MTERTLVALYDDVEDATQAVHELESSGFQDQELSLVAGRTENAAEPEAPAPAPDASRAAEGAGTGATIGTILGSAAGLTAALGALAVPGIGPVLAAGPLAAAITGAGIGAATGGVIGGLVGMGVPERDARTYSEGVRRGGALVTARVAAHEARRAVKILERHDALDIEDRSMAWRESGWAGLDERAPPWRAARHTKSTELLRRGTDDTGRDVWRAAEEDQTMEKRKNHDLHREPGSTGNLGGGEGDRTEPRQARPEEAGAGREDEFEERSEELRHGTVEREADTAELQGGPQPTAMSGMFGSVEDERQGAGERVPAEDELVEQEEPLKRHGGPSRRRVRDYPAENESTDRAMAGGKPKDTKER